MSYYKVRSVAFKQSIGKIYVTCADSSLRPLNYIRSEYAENIQDFTEKCKIFWQDVLSGNMQFAYSNKWHAYVNDTYQQMRRIAKGINVHMKDLDYKTNFYDELQEYVAKTYLVPIVTKEAKHIDIDFEADFAERCQKKWEEIDKERLENKQISIRAALTSYVFPGWDTLLCEKENRTIVAKRCNYHLGLLDNADETAVILPEGSGHDWSRIAYANASELQKIFKKYPQLINAVIVEASYQSKERAAMDGYEKVFESDEKCLYVKETDGGMCTYAEVCGYC